MTFKPVLCWFATFSTMALIVAWVMTIWCTMRWTCSGGRWIEISDGRLTGGFQSHPDSEFTDFDILARKGPVAMRWGFDSDDRRPLTWAVPIWAPLLLCGTLGAWAWRGGNAYCR